MTLEVVHACSSSFKWLLGKFHQWTPPNGKQLHHCIVKEPLREPKSYWETKDAKRRRVGAWKLDRPPLLQKTVQLHSGSKTLHKMENKDHHFIFSVRERATGEMKSQEKSVSCCSGVPPPPCPSTHPVVWPCSLPDGIHRGYETWNKCAPTTCLESPWRQRAAKSVGIPLGYCKSMLRARS